MPLKDYRPHETSYMALMLGSLVVILGVAGLIIWINIANNTPYIKSDGVSCAKITDESLLEIRANIQKWQEDSKSLSLGINKTYQIEASGVLPLSHISSEGIDEING